MSGRAIWIVLGIAKPPLLTSSSDGSTLFPSTSILASDDAVISSYSMPKRLIRKWFCASGTRAVLRSPWGDPGGCCGGPRLRGFIEPQRQRDPAASWVDFQHLDTDDIAGL